MNKLGGPGPIKPQDAPKVPKTKPGKKKSK